MEIRKLEEWAKRLLDTGKRNNLVNFKDSKMMTVEMVFPGVDTVFDKLTGGTKLEAYDPQQEEDVFLAEQQAKEATSAVVSSEPAAEADPEKEETTAAEPAAEAEEAPAQPSKSAKELYIERCSRHVKKASQVLLYSSSGLPMATLNNIDKKAKSNIEETGVNVAYMAFGFVNWTEKGNKAVYKAPILLVPVVLSRETFFSSYHIKAIDEAIVNPTFNYKLKSEQGFAIPDYADEGLLVYLEKVGKMMEKLEWTVSNECKIGIFSFLKVNMYQDLTDHADKILANENILRLLGEEKKSEEPDETEQREETEKPEQSEETEKPEVLHNVVDADSSQVEAIRMAKAGESFVLQGPPGTGKSQTITNIIAECLYDGKKVLFVSEKQAALNVVYDKLKKAGLEDFCLELHSFRANRKTVVDELCRTLRLPKTSVSQEAETEIATRQRAQTQLDSYAAELHRVQPVIHKSLYDLYEEYFALGKTAGVDYNIPKLREKGNVYLDEAERLLEQYISYIPVIGKDYRSNIWYGYRGEDISGIAQTELTNQLRTVSDGVKKLIVQADNLSRSYGIVALTMDECMILADFFYMMKQSEVIRPALLNKNACNLCAKKISRMQEMAAVIADDKEDINAIFDDSFDKIDGREVNNKLVKLYSSGMSRMFNAEYKKIINDLRLSSKKNRKFSYEEAVEYTELIGEYQRKMDDYRELEDSIKGFIGPAYKGIDSNWEEIKEELINLTWYCDNIKFGSLESFDVRTYENARKSLAAAGQEMDDILKSISEAREALAADFDPSVLDLVHMDMVSVFSKLDGCLAAMDSRNGWISFYLLMKKLEEADLTDYVNYTLDKNIDPGTIVPVYRKLFIRQWIDKIIYLTPVIAGFARAGQDQAVKDFIEKDHLSFNISKSQIREKLSAKRPDISMMSSGGPVSVILREGEKKRRQKNIRTLFAETGDVIQKIKPCFMMSPLSVSTYLDPDKLHFDVVIFDEASQIFPEDAVGAIYRGKQLIVVGDSRQMPPTNFFNSIVEAEEVDEEVGDVVDFESVLDICSAVLPQKRLNWHYRSRSEELISFSNKNFYGGGLVTFPSAESDHTGVGVDYYHVDGIFDRTRHVNLIEAQVIADLVFWNIDTYPERSLGVVAFSAAQQTLIDYVLTRKRMEDPSKEWFFAADRKEPFFVKNLETVQGDERDTIIFSVAYGKDDKGRLLLNFGPLNKEGGERRLNVAITRAKINVQVVSSMHYTDIDLARTESVGARLFRDYLEYAESAETGSGSAEEAGENEEIDDRKALERDVYDFLVSQGFSVDRNIGRSEFKIDFGIRGEEEGKYILAVECDGRSYQLAENVRDRDRLRQENLERMGWRYYRIWSTDWFKNNRVEKDRLLRAITEALEAAKQAPAEENQAEKQAGEQSGNEQITAQLTGASETVTAGETASAGQPMDRSMAETPVTEQETSPNTVQQTVQPLEEENFEEETAPMAHVFPQYKTADFDKLSGESGSLPEFVRKVLEIEAPLSEELLLRRMLYLYGLDKMNQSYRDNYEKEMLHCDRYGIIRRNGFLYLDGQKEFAFRIPGDLKRDLIDISDAELATGLFTYIKANGSVDRDGLYRDVIKQLGCSRMTDQIKMRLDHVMTMLGQLVITDGNKITIREN